MKTLITILLFIARLYIGFKIALWIYSKSMNPQSHQLSEIEVYLVFVIFDTWLTSFSNNLEIEIKRIDV
mgnify:CR=1 FL=1